MRYCITVEPDYVDAELFDRQTPEETREFLAAVAAECLAHQRFRVLISVRSSRPIFRAEKYGFSSFAELAVKYAGRIAVLADSAEGRIAQEYAVMLARLRGVDVRTFRERTAAMRWLTEPRAGAEPRQGARASPLGVSGRAARAPPD